MRRTLLASSISPALAFAQLQCPAPTDWWADLDLPEGPQVHVASREADLSDPNELVLIGDVELRNAEQELKADEVRYNRGEDRAQASGDIRYRTPDAFLQATSADIEMGAERAHLEGVRYYLRDGGRGRAEKADLRGDDTATMSTVDYTGCPSDAEGWRLVAREIELDNENGVGRARSVRLEFLDTPILYLPYARFPLNDERQSGFLYPSLGSSNDDGLDFSIPYYLHLAPNYDATLTPRWITDRGPMLGVEFRYLADFGRGEFNAEYLHDDDKLDTHRSYVRLRHSGAIGDRFNLGMNLNHVSDADYFEDFGDSLTAGSRSILGSTVALTTAGRHYQLALSADAYEIVDQDIGPEQEPYNRLPRGVLSIDRPLTQIVDFELDSELVAFERDVGTEGARLDLFPRLTASFLRPGYYVTPTVGYRYTTYDLKDTDSDSPSRSLPIASLEGGLIFDRPTSDGGLQTLEPRFYYLYVPYEDQGALPRFDTRELTFGFSQLFRTNRFTGADRQADANQVTVALTTRLFDDRRSERLNLSVGTIAYLRDQRVQLAGASKDYQTSPLVAEFNYRPSEFWGFSAGFQYDPEDDEFDQSALGLTYRRPGGTIASLAYRQRRGLVRQADLSWLSPINDRWQLVGRVNYSFRDDTDLETLLGVQYGSCCWAIRAFARRYLRNQEGEHRNGLYFELELKGLGSLGRRVDRVLERAIAGYRSEDYR